MSVLSLKEMLAFEIQKAKSKDLINTYFKVNPQAQFKKNKIEVIINNSNNNSKKSVLLDFSLCIDKVNMRELIDKPTKKLIKTKSKSIYDKALSFNILRESKLDKERYNKRLEELNSMHSPKMNHKSIIIASKNKSRNTPLYLRISEVQEQHQKQLSILRETYVNKDKDKHLFITRKQSASSFNTWLTMNNQRAIEKKKKLKQMKNDLLNKEKKDMKIKMPFKPYINERSKTIVKAKRSYYNNSSYSSKIDQTSERLYRSYFNYQNHKSEMLKQSLPSFKPSISFIHLSRSKTSKNMFAFKD